jgi:hypothetical protein
MIKYTLIIFLFTNLDTYTGNFYTPKQKFNTYHECIEYVEQHRVDSTTGFGQVFTPTNQIIGLTYCKPIDIQ